MKFLSLPKIPKHKHQGRTIHLLNKLVKTNNDRIKGYQTASSETDEPELQSSFADFVSNSLKCSQELANEIITLGGIPTDKTKISGKIFRTWMDLKAALTGRDLRPILSSCDIVEVTAIGTYRRILKNQTALLSARQHLMITAHNERLTADHSRLVLMRNAILLAV